MKKLTWKGIIEDVRYGKCSYLELESLIDVVINIVKHTPSIANKAYYNLADLSYATERSIQDFNLEVIRITRSNIKEEWKCIFTKGSSHSLTAIAIIEEC